MRYARPSQTVPELNTRPAASAVAAAVQSAAPAAMCFIPLLSSTSPTGPAITMTRSDTYVLKYGFEDPVMRDALSSRDAVSSIDIASMGSLKRMAMATSTWIWMVSLNRRHDGRPHQSIRDSYRPPYPPFLDGRG